MPYRQLTLASAILLLLVFIFPGRSVQAVPLLPSSFYGKVLVNNVPVADGTEVQALVNGQVVASGLTQPYQGSSYYSLSVPSDDNQTAGVEGGKEGDVIQFTVGGLAAAETGFWHSGTNIQLDLTVTTSATPQPPQPTRTPLPTQTSIQAVSPTSTPTLAPVFPSATQPAGALSPTLTLAGQTVTDATSIVTEVVASPSMTGSAKVSPTSTIQLVSEANPASQARRKTQTLAIGIILLAAVTALVWAVRGKFFRNQK